MKGCGIIVVIVIVCCCCCWSITTNITFLLLFDDAKDDTTTTSAAAAAAADFVVDINNIPISSILDDNKTTNVTAAERQYDDDDDDDENGDHLHTPIIYKKNNDNDNDDEKEQQQQQQQNTSSVIVLPSINNTMIVLIAMGNTHETLIVERCIRSIRTSGSFLGPILVLIDSHRSYKRYNETILSSRGDDDSNNVILLWMPQKRKHYDNNNPLFLPPDDDDDEKYLDDDEVLLLLRQHRIKMGYKRYKTLLPEILDDCCSDYFLYNNNYIRYILYLDIDNVIADKLQYLFDDIENLMLAKQKQQQQQQQTKGSSSSFLLQFQDPGQTHKLVWHTGVMLIDRYQSRQCLQQWRKTIDSALSNPTTNEVKSDQQLLLKSLNNSSSESSCYIHPLPIDKNFGLPDKTILEWESKGHYNNKYPVIVHITNTHRIYKIPPKIQSEFLHSVLHITDDSSDTTIQMMTDTIPWKSVATIQKFHVVLPPNQQRGNNILYKLLQQLRRKIINLF